MPEACNFIQKETLAQVFSCEFCEISKNTFFTEHLWTTASKMNDLKIILGVPDNFFVNWFWKAFVCFKNSKSLKFLL